MRFLIFAGVVAMVLALAACATPPVQAMSNARQAVRAAEDAGAARYAPADLAEAKRWLDDAEFALDGNDYTHARASAKQAVDAARKATDTARRAEEAGAPASTPVPESSGGLPPPRSLNGA